MVKNLPANAVDMLQVQSLGREDPLEEGMATHSSVLAWRIPWTEDPGRLLSIGFSRQEYWSGLPFPTPGDLPDPGFPALQVDSLPFELQPVVAIRYFKVINRLL